MKGANATVITFPLRRKNKERRVTVMCVKCRRNFRYIYPGTGPYRSVCNRKHKEEK